MKTNAIRTPVALATLLLVLAANVPAHAQSTVFTYQGSLDDAGAPASGLHDFRFRLFDVPSGGSPIGSTLCVDNVNVVEGVFTTLIDFGSFATTAPRFIEVEVRRDTGITCGSAAGFVVMAPRQQITPTPMANHAKSAFALDAADGSPANAVFVDNSGNVGIGTMTPETKLHLNGADEGLRIDGPGLGAAASAYVSFRDADGVRTGYVGDGSAWDASVYLASDAGDVHLYTGAAALTAKNNGNVGIGTTMPAAKLDVQGGNVTIGGNVGVGTSAPNAKLDVRGDIKLGPSGQFQATAGEENLRVIRGKVDGNGNILAGTGFSVIRTAEGEYTITFNTPFAGTPIMTASPEYVVQQDFNLAWIDAISSSQMRVILVNFAGTGPDDGAFHFIATGPR